MSIGIIEFRAIKEAFLAVQDNTKNSEWWDTDQGVYRHVLEDLENFLFRAEKDLAARHAEYLKLKAEFEP